jgi:hypothetical protein
MKKLTVLLIGAMTSGFLFAEEAKEDPKHFEKLLSSNYENIKKQVCSQLNLNVNIETSPFLYTDPDAACDLGLKFPGLPDFNLGLDGLDSCAILKSVTGALVSEVNKEMRDAVSSGLEGIGLEDGDLDIDFGDMVINEIEENNGGG